MLGASNTPRCTAFSILSLSVALTFSSAVRARTSWGSKPFWVAVSAQKSGSATVGVDALRKAIGLSGGAAVRSQARAAEETASTYLQMTIMLRLV